MKKATGRAVPKPIEFDYELFLKDIALPPTDLWLRHLASDQRSLADFSRFLNLMIGRVQQHAMSLRGDNIEEQIVRLQGGERAFGDLRRFVNEWMKQQSATKKQEPIAEG
jgi:hypothetical protein